MASKPVLDRRPDERESLAERIAEHMDAPVTVLGIIFLLVVLADTVARPTGGVAVFLTVLTWLLWAVFAAEFVLRAVIAPDRVAFFRRHWWQLVFLVLPFLRFARIIARIRIARVARAGRVVSSAVRTSRSALGKLSGRLSWLGAVTVIVILASSQLLFEFSDFDRYGDALHAAALSTITGERIAAQGTLVRVLEIALAAYSVIVFAALAGSLGAFFLERPAEKEAADTRLAETP